MDTPRPGQVGWFDLTVNEAESVRRFYENVVGWTSEPIEMEGYNDHCMKPPAAEAPVAGICHARGSNASLPPQWLIYITVANLDASLKQCTLLGGSVIASARDAGAGRYAVIRDPAGAACALYQSIETPA